MGLNIVLREEVAKDVGRLGVGKGALLDELVAALRIGVGDVAGDSINRLALSEGVGGGIERAGFLSGFDHNDDIGEARDKAIAVEERRFRL